MSKDHKIVEVETPAGRSTYAIPESVMHQIRLKLYGSRAEDIAEATGLSVATIYAIKSGRTVWPRGRTIALLFDYLGLELRVYDIQARRYLQ